MSDAVYQVREWPTLFEGAKSKTYNNKTSCQMPTKHGLGYRRLIRSKSGPAMFGAWCAMVQVLSRHAKPRHGYLTDTGRIDGRPLTPSDLAFLTDIPAAVYAKLFERCLLQDVNWLVLVQNSKVQGYRADTARIPQGSLDLDSDSNSDLDTDSDSDSRATSRPLSEAEYKKHPSLVTLHAIEALRGITLEDWLLCIRRRSPHMDMAKAVQYVADKAEIQGGIAKPVPFLDAYLGYYETNHLAEIRIAEKAAAVKKGEYRDTVNAIREYGDNPKYAAARKRWLDKMGEAYGATFVERAEAEAAK